MGSERSRLGLAPAGPVERYSGLSEIITSVTGRANVQDSSRLHVTSFVAQVAEVAVDPDTGHVTLLKFTTAHDAGRVVNPIMHQGQVNGGFMQGLGYALMEQLRVEDGRVTSLSFGDYKVPTARDIPPLWLLLALLPIYAIGYTTSAFLLGRAIVRPPTSRFLAFLAGWGILRAIALVPGLGALAWFGATVFGLGALTVALWRSRRGPVTAAPLTA